jgi:hypothetical protein
MVEQNDSAPELVTELADGCVRYVEQAVGVKLDYTQDTLPLLDHYLQMGPDASQQEVVALVAPMAGAYFGEVVRQHLQGARWHAPPDDYQAWRIEFDRCFLHFNPIGMALEALLGEDAEGWAGHLQVLDEDREALKEALEQLGEVQEEDFYKLGVRFEVLEQAHQFLMSRAQNEPDRNRQFGPEAYAAAVNAGSPKQHTTH